MNNSDKALKETKQVQTAKPGGPCSYGWSGLGLNIDRSGSGSGLGLGLEQFLSVDPGIELGLLLGLGSGLCSGPGSAFMSGVGVR